LLLVVGAQAVRLRLLAAAAAVAVLWLIQTIFRYLPAKPLIFLLAQAVPVEQMEITMLGMVVTQA
jgi:hypothetical protein